MVPLGLCTLISQKENYKNMKLQEHESRTYLLYPQAPVMINILSTTKPSLHTIADLIYRTIRQRTNSTSKLYHTCLQQAPEKLESNC